ncbi:MAG: TfoX/Sxy family protein [Pseudomonadota bacterium]
MPYDEHLAERLRRALGRREDIQEKRMFGCACWMLRGNLLCAAEVGRYMFRVGPSLEAEALSRPGASPMDATGRPMRGIVWVDAAVTPDSALDQWIELADRFVGNLPVRSAATKAPSNRKRGTQRGRSKAD